MYKRFMKPDVRFNPIYGTDHQQSKRPNNNVHGNMGLFPGNMGGLLSFLPDGTDLGDVILLLILLLLYVDSKDEEFLIMLITTACSIFNVKLA